MRVNDSNTRTGCLLLMSQSLRAPRIVVNRVIVARAILTSGQRQRTMWSMSAPAQLRSAISRAKMTQLAAAKALGIQAPTLCRILAGDRRPSLDLALRIARLFSVPAKAWERMVHVRGVRL